VAPLRPDARASILKADVGAPNAARDHTGRLGDGPFSAMVVLGDEVTATVGCSVAGAGDAGIAVGPAVREESGPNGGGVAAGIGEIGVVPHAARTTPRRRDAAQRVAFISR
jgi:hypothetical protein